MGEPESLTPEQERRVRVIGIFDDDRRRQTYLDAVVAARAEQLGVRLEEWPLTRAHVEAAFGSPDPAGLAAVEQAARDHAVERLKALAEEALDLAGSESGDAIISVRPEIHLARASAYLAAVDLVAGVVL
jgi:hypothetical protein